MTLIIGSGGGGKGDDRGGKRHETKDNLDSKQFAKVLDLIGEGEMSGLKDGAKSIFLNNTPLQDSNGTFNFKDVSFSERTGTSSQTFIPITSDIETTKATGLSTIVAATPGVVQITDSEVDAVKVIISVPVLQRITDEGDIYGSHFELQIAVQYQGGSYQTVVSGNNGEIRGRTADLYQREYLINLSGNFPVNIKVTRVTADSSDSKIVNAFQWNNYVEVKFKKLAYPNTALVGLRVDAEQFTSIPSRKYLVRGIKVKIPHNATPRADGSLSYSGIFNGTLGAAQYTNDPAFVLFDLLTSERYGCNLDEASIDKFAFQAASAYASELVDDGTGTGNMEPRYSTNISLQTRQEAFNVINQLSSVMRAMPIYQAGSITISCDKPRDASFLFTLANVLEPGFTYSSSSQRVRPTVVVAKYLDLEKRDVSYEQFIDTENQARYGTIVRNIDAFACTSRGQALRLAKWTAYMENVERELVTFKTSIDAGVTVRPGQVIEIADPVKSGERRGGRIKAVNSTTEIEPDDITGLSIVGSPTLSILMPDNTVETKTVTGLGGGVFTLNSALSTTPNVNSVWVYQTTTIQTTQWRVVSVVEQDRVNYEIVAIQYNSSKYNHVENNLALTTRDITNLDIPPLAPTNLTIEEIIYENTGIARVKLIVSWTSVTDSVFVRWRFEDGNWESRTIDSAKGYEILDTVAGSYEIEAYGVSASGLRSSTPSTQTFIARGKTDLPLNVSGVSLLPIDETSGILSWNRATELDVLLNGAVLIRHSKLTSGAQWHTAQEIITKAAGSQTQKIVPLLTGTYLLKFEDDTGHQSPSPGSSDSDWNNTRVTATLPTPTERLLVSNVDEHTANFTGSKTNTVYNSGSDALRLTTSSNATATSGEYEFANSVDLGQVFDVNLQRNIASSSFFINSLWDDRTDLVDDWGDIDSVGSGTSEATKCNVALFVRSTNDNPSGSPTYSDYKEFSNVLLRGRHFQFKAKLTSTDTNQNINVTELGVKVELQSRVESIATPITTGSSTKSVTFTNAFKEAPSVQITQTSNGQQSGDFFELANVTRSGFEVTFKQGGSAVARSFVYAAVGFGKEI